MGKGLPLLGEASQSSKARVMQGRLGVRVLVTVLALCLACAGPLLLYRFYENTTAHTEAQKEVGAPRGGNWGAGTRAPRGTLTLECPRAAAPWQVLESFQKLLKEMVTERDQAEAKLGATIASTIKQLQSEVRAEGGAEGGAVGKVIRRRRRGRPPAPPRSSRRSRPTWTRE